MHERDKVQRAITEATRRLAGRRALIYEYVQHRLYELQFSDLARDIFGSARQHVDGRIADILADGEDRLGAITAYMATDNPENWANAVHSCRRLLQALADGLYPPSKDPVVTPGGKTVQVGKTHYINRLVCFIESKASSASYASVVGTNLQYLIERVNAVYKATNKGTHDTVEKHEAERYVLYTYLLVSDVLSLTYAE